MMTRVLALCVGTAVPFARGEISAIDKRPVEGPIRIGKLGLEHDDQADCKHHGGEEMALHAYANDHFDWWLGEIGPHHRLPAPGSFGENLALRGLTEDAVLIGDRFRLGTALIEVSQPRQPCWKLETHLRRTGVIKRILKTHRCGWYFRVIEEGEAAAGAALERVEAGHDNWTLCKTFGLLLDPSVVASRQDMANMATLERLSPQWRERANAIAQS